jgi:hypothetical protein
VEGARLEGLAQVIFSHERQQTGSDCDSTGASRTVIWGAELDGSYILLPDERGGPGTESIVSFTVTPSQGPAYTFIIEGACGGSIQETGPPWLYEWSGNLVDGRYDLRADNGVGPDQTGEAYQIIHLEQTQDK